MVDTRQERWVQSGRAFSAGEIAQIRETVAWLPKLPRTELAATVCEHLRWHTVTGTPKVHACGQLLARLETAGLVQLPALRARPPRRARQAVAPAGVAGSEAPLCGPLSAEYHWQFMIVLREESLASVWEEFHGLQPLLPENHHRCHWGGRAQHFTWVNDIDYGFRQDGANHRLHLHVVVCRETWQTVDARGTLADNQARHAWLSSRPLSAANVHPRCNLAAHQPPRDATQRLGNIRPPRADAAGRRSPGG